MHNVTVLEFGLHFNDSSELNADAIVFTENAKLGN